MYIRKIPSTRCGWKVATRTRRPSGGFEEHRLLDNIVPVDPISRFIHFFSNAHTLPFFLVLAVFFLWKLLRGRRSDR